MAKRSFAKSKCLEVVETIKERKISKVHDEDLYHEVSRPESYRRKTRNVIRRLREKTSQELPAFQASARSSVRSLQSSNRIREAIRPQKQFNSLEALSYQARFNTQVSVRSKALEDLVSMDSFAEETLTTLEEALDDPLAEMREKAAALLEGYPTPLTPSLMDKLIARAWDPEITVRKAVVRSLTNHPDPRSIGVLSGILGTQDDELYDLVYQALIDICKKLGPPPARVDGDA